MSIKPGVSVKLVVEVDPRTERISARNSTVYDVDGERLVLGQTEPAIGDSMLNKEIAVTYLTKEKDGPVRYGFPAVITELIDNYRLMSTQQVPAMAIRKTADPTPYNIRMYYRVEPTGRSGLDMTIHAKGVNILDISLGGVRFTYDSEALEPPSELGGGSPFRHKRGRLQGRRHNPPDLGGGGRRVPAGYHLCRGRVSQRDGGLRAGAVPQDPRDRERKPREADLASHFVLNPQPIRTQ